MQSRPGFSLLELIVAIGLMGVLVVLVTPSLADFSAPFRVQSGGREIYSALQEVRQQAITRGRRTRFQVIGSDSYALQWDSAGTWTTLRGPLRLEPDVRLSSTGGDLIFQPRGIVSPASTLTVTDPASSTHRLEITVPITGLVRIRAGGG
jgi:prepilin-type N-terminal cleavage/methylation domain-containing protein